MLKKTLLVLAALASITLIMNYAAPNLVKVEREITINHPKNFVFGYLRFFSNRITWSPFLEKDPKAVVKINGTDGMIGSSLYWSSANMSLGAGEEEIKKIIENELIEYELRFKIPFKATCQTSLHLESVDKDVTKVKWKMLGKLPFPINIISMVKPDFSEAIGKDFEHGLEKLKSQMEKLISMPDFKL